MRIFFWNHKDRADGYNTAKLYQLGSGVLGVVFADEQCGVRAVKHRVITEPIDFI